MKYLELNDLDLLSRSLSFTSNECKVRTRIEAYSCKLVKSDKKLFKLLENTYNNDDGPLYSPFGSLRLLSSRKTLYLLISTLNQAYPDHDFTYISPDEFVKEPSSSAVINRLGLMLLKMKDGNTRSYGYYPTLGSSVESHQSFDDHQSHLTAQSTLRRLKTGGMLSLNGFTAIIDEVINIQDCDVYSYSPDASSDPHAAFDDDDDDISISDGIDDSDDDDLSTSKITKRKNDLDDDDQHFDLDMDESETENNTTKSSIPNHVLDDEYRQSSPALSNRSTGQSTLGDSASGLLWSTHYFFYNKKMKRVLFFSLWSRKAGIYSQGPSHLPMSADNPFWLSSSLPPPIKLEDDEMNTTSMLSRSMPSKSMARGRKSTNKTKARAGGAGGSKPVVLPGKRRAANASISKSSKIYSDPKKTKI